MGQTSQTTDESEKKEPPPLQHVSTVNIAEFQKHLDKHWHDKRCVVCGSIDWIISEHIYEMSSLRDFGPPLAAQQRRLYPLVPVMCKTCGLLMNFNPLPAGWGTTWKGDES